MQNHNRVKKIGESLRSTGALINIVGLVATGAAGIEASTASAAPQRSAGIEQVQGNPEFRKDAAKELRKLKSLFQQIDASRKPQMLYGALEITAHKKITAHGTPDVKNSGVLDTGLITPGESVAIVNPIFTKWHGHEIVYSYHNDSSGTVPNRPVDIKGLDLAIKYILSNKKHVSDQEYLRITHSFGEVRIFDMDQLKRDASLNYWQYQASPLNQIGTKPQGDGFLIQAETNAQYPPSGMCAYFGYHEFNTDQYGNFYTANQYLKMFGYHKKPYTPKF